MCGLVTRYVVTLTFLLLVPSVAPLLLVLVIAIFVAEIVLGGTPLSNIAVVERAGFVIVVLSVFGELVVDCVIVVVTSGVVVGILVV